MGFTPKDWINETDHAGPAASPPGTPISAAALEDLETRVTDYADIAGGNIFNVLEYGAIGNGVFDSEPAFTSALNAAGTAGGMVFVPAGTFVLGSTITVPEGVRLSGSGYTSEIQTDDGIYAKSHTEIDHLQINTATTFTRGTDNLPTTTGLRAIVYFHDDPNRPTNCKAHDLIGDGLEIGFFKCDEFWCYNNILKGGWYGAIAEEGCTDGYLWGNRVKWAGSNGFGFYGGQRFKVWGNISKDNEQSGFYSYGVMGGAWNAGATDIDFFHNTASGSVTEEGFDLPCGAADDVIRVKIIGNHVYDNESWGIHTIGSGVIIANNHVHDNGACAIRCDWDPLIEAQADAFFVQIKDNYCKNNNIANWDDTNGIGILIDGAQDCHVTGNLVIQDAGGNDYPDGFIYVTAGNGNIIADNRIINEVGGSSAAPIVNLPDPAGYMNHIHDNMTGTSQGVASGGTISLPSWSNSLVEVSGTATVTHINPTFRGHVVTLLFAGNCQVTDGDNLGLAGNFSPSTANNWDTLTLVCDSVNWTEIARSAN